MCTIIDLVIVIVVSLPSLVVDDDSAPLSLLLSFGHLEMTGISLSPKEFATSYRIASLRPGTLSRHCAPCLIASPYFAVIDLPQLHAAP